MTLRQLQFQGDSIVSTSLREALTGNAKKKIRMFAQWWFCYISMQQKFGVRLPVRLVNKNKVLMLIKH